MKYFYSRAVRGLLMVVAVVSFTLGCFALGAAAQSGTSIGGSFLPAANYVLSGVWTFKGASPLVFEGATNDSVTTTLTVADPTANNTLTVPNTTGALPVVLDCQSTGTGSQTCVQQTATGLGKVYVGKSTLSSNAATVTFSPGFTGTTDFMCVANDVTTRANPVQMIPASATTATITNTTGGSDVIQWICAGQ